MDPQAEVAQFQERFAAIHDAVGTVLVGQHNLVSTILTALCANGHVLIEGVPGLGKTLLVRTLADVLDLPFSRIQFTPDLMPADVVGTSIIVEDAAGKKTFAFQRGPVFGSLVLADEINRATPKTQSAMLEAMQERQVTVGGTRHPLPDPFLVMATQNPIEMAGTYPLPEAQLDRFLMKARVPFPSAPDLVRIAQRTTGAATQKAPRVCTREEVLAMQRLVRGVPAADHVVAYAAQLVMATHPDQNGAPKITRKYVRYGGSPRAVQSIMLAAKVRALTEGRYNVSFKDVRVVAPAAMRHRLVLNFEGEADGIEPDAILADLLKEVRPPAKT